MITRGRGAGAWIAGVLLVGAAIGARAPAWAADGGAPPPAPADSLERYLRSVADSTSAYFGLSAAPPDTVGLDSLLEERLRHPLPGFRPPRVLHMHPELDFNRVDGPVYHLAASLDLRRLGTIGGRIGWASGPNDVLWRGEYRIGGGRRTAPWGLHVTGGIETGDMDREHSSRKLAALRAFLVGKDSHHYLRREGVAVRASHGWGRWQAGAGYRDQDERPIATSAGWNLLHRHLTRFDNLPARAGRVREVELLGAVSLAPVPFDLEIQHHSSSHALDSDFEYRRTRAVLSGDVGIGRWAAFVPQIAYGRLSGEALPQASFYLGGSRAMRSLPSSARGGTGYALARLEVIGTRDVLAALRVPHPAILPLQLGAFAGMGSVWGVDPYGGPVRPGVDWPESADWVSEAGVSVIYQPGFPDPTSLLRVNVAWPLGPARETRRVTISYSRALDLLRRVLPSAD